MPDEEEVKLIELEMSYTPYSASCREPVIVASDDLRVCRRASGHPPNWHASGFGERRHLW